MKYFIHLFSTLTIMIAVSCSKDIVDQNTSCDDNSIKSGYSISLNQIRQYLSEQSSTLPTKGFNFKIEPITEGRDTVLYLVNYEDGWEAFSADKRAPKIFAKAEKGTITEGDFKTIPALKCMYESFVENVLFLKKNPNSNPTTDFLDSWDDLDGTSRTSRQGQSIKTRSVYQLQQSHLLQTKWGQGHPWNIRAPYTDETRQTHCLTGCGPVAMAQVMYYLQSRGAISYNPYEDSYTNKFIPDNTDYIILNDTDVSFTSPASSPSVVWGSMPIDSLDTGNGKSFEAVSTLMVELGMHTQSEYYRHSTSTWSNYVPDTFIYQYFFPTNYGDVDFDVLADLILQDNLPAILLIGHLDNLNHLSNGHYIVADAIEETYQESGGDLLSRYIGFNWGWDGLCDDYWFNTDVINWFANNIVFNSRYYMVYIVSL